jgi:methylglutaconyl-CoA hydratase
VADSYVKVEVFKKWAQLEFFHPKGNSLPSELLSEMKNQVEGLKQKQIKVLHIKSAGKHFCAGASFDELLSINDIDASKKFFSGFAQLINSIQNAPFLVFVSQQGSAVGGGVGLLSAADYVIASKQARSKLSELSIGIGPFAIQPALSNKMGQNWYPMTLNPKKWYSSEEILQFGLVDEVVEESRLDEVMQSKIQEFISYSNKAIINIKEIRTKASFEKMLAGAEKSARLLLQEEAQLFLNEYRNTK